MQFVIRRLKMLKNKRLIIIVAVLVILVAVTFISCLAGSDKTGGAQGTEDNSVPGPGVDFYLTILDAVWEEDSGLNPVNGVVVFDLTGVNNLTNGEKDELIARAKERFGASEAFASTFEQLSKDGYIDDKYLQFKAENSILITLSSSKEEANSFKFKAEKWCSGIGAVYFEDCTATEKDSVWEFELGGFAIS
jgi:hypothetical protein